MVDSTDGILLLDKEINESSYGVVKKVKAALGGRRAPKIGHAGTLDPIATGLLVILLGQGTKLSRFIMSQKKMYLATLRLGEETDTLDAAGCVVRRRKVPAMDREGIQARAQNLVGEIDQVPPAYSAVKFQGRRAYDLARRGIDVVLQPRKVTIHSLQIQRVDLPEITIRVVCSAGTYIRSLSADLGRLLGPGAHVSSLRRLASGSFHVEAALNSIELTGAEIGRTLYERVIPMAEALPEMHSVEVSPGLAKWIRQGGQPSWSDLSVRTPPAPGHEYIKIVCDGSLTAIMQLKEDREGGHDGLKTVRVFH